MAYAITAMRINEPRTLIRCLSCIADATHRLEHAAATAIAVSSDRPLRLGSTIASPGGRRSTTDTSAASPSAPSPSERLIPTSGPAYVSCTHSHPNARLAPAKQRTHATDGGGGSDLDPE